MTAIVFPGAIGVKENVVGFADGFPSLRVFPKPFGKGLFEQFLLALGDGGFLFVQHRRLAAIGVILIIENADIL